MIFYSLLSLIGILVAFGVSKLLDMPKPNKKAQLDIYMAAVVGTIIGAKLPVWVSYGFHPELIFSGKSVMGGILGAFVALNVYKFATQQRGEALGGRFVIPLAVAVGFGKIGCWLYGCCGGEFFMPVQLFESGFQFFMAFVLYLFYRRTHRIDLLFPLYLFAYIVMRFGIEFVRTEPRFWLDMTIYQWMALVFAPIILSILYQRRKSYG